jgi:CheY-like chemotaxis protein
MTRILVVEDQPAILANVARMLRLEGFEVLTARNGAEGLSLALEEQPSLILCDVRMPEMNGDELLDRLGGDSRTAAIPVIFTTASAENPGREDRMLRGAADYLVKPYDFKELLASIRRHLP